MACGGTEGKGKLVAILADRSSWSELASVRSGVKGQHAKSHDRMYVLVSTR